MTLSTRPYASRCCNWTNSTNRSPIFSLP